MAVPKRRTSKSKKGMRRAHKNRSAQAMATCDNCGESKMPHRACASCGTYKGRDIVTPSDL